MLSKHESELKEITIAHILPPPVSLLVIVRCTLCARVSITSHVCLRLLCYSYTFQGVYLTYVTFNKDAGTMDTVFLFRQKWNDHRLAHEGNEYGSTDWNIPIDIQIILWKPSIMLSNAIELAYVRHMGCYINIRLISQDHYLCG